MKMGKKNKKKDRTPPPPMPRNTVSLSLDGDEITFTRNFLSSQAHLQYWMLCNSGFRIRFDPGTEQTLSGTFYYVIRYRERYLVFVIMARTAWLIGFCSAKGFFQVESKEIKGLFMDSSHTNTLPFDGNHKAISSEGTGSTSINLGAIRRRFDVLCDYAGSGSHHDPLEIASCLGFFVVLLMESKSKEICKRHCSSLLDCTEFTLGNDWVNGVITNWSSISQQIMQFLDENDYQPHDCGIEYLKESKQLLDAFYYPHVDGYFTGLFKHDKMESEPRVLLWDPIDSGVGDGDIVVRGEPVPQKSGSIRNRGRPKEKEDQKRRGLSGGGLGGPPAAPQVFQTWAQSANNDKNKCDMLVSHLNLMGLTVLQAKRKLEHLGQETKATSDTVEAKEKPAAVPSPQEHLHREQTHTPKLLEGLVKRINTVAKTASIIENPMSLIRSSNPLSPVEITSLEDEKNPKEISDAPEVEEKPVATLIPLEHLCEKVKKSAVLESNEKQTSTPKLVEGLVKWLDTFDTDVSSTKKPVALIRSNNSLSPAEISSLEDGQFISDLVINLVLDNLMSYLGSKDIHDVQLVDPIVSFLMCRDPNDAISTAQSLNLSLSRLVLLPVNDNEDLNRAGGGRHWSLLVFDQWTQYGPRLIHYDSYNNSNFAHACKLADLISPYLPNGTADIVEGETPQQGNNYDCGVYLMGIAACICEWCVHASASASTGRQDADWSRAMSRDVTSESVTSLRTWLRQAVQE